MNIYAVIDTNVIVFLRNSFDRKKKIKKFIFGYRQQKAFPY